MKAVRRYKESSKKEFLRLTWRFVKDKITREYFWKVFSLNYRDQGQKLLEKEWDYLFIVDACRKDMFSEVYGEHLDGELSSIESKASSTGLFLKRNFAEEYHDNLVYVSASPRVEEDLDDVFYEKINVWKEKDWDEELGRVPAEKMKEYCLRTAKLYPDKRIIFHFLEPHLSVQQYEGVELSDPSARKKYSDFTDRSALRKFLSGKISKSFPGPSLWVLFQNDDIPKHVVWEKQEKLLHEALDVISDISGNLDGKKVVTSDHGNAYGEKIHKYLPWNVYEHPKYIRTKNLIEVPWFEIHED